MPKIITFSRTYPSYHPKAGQPTHFVEKIWKSLGGISNEYKDNFITADFKESIVWGYQLVDGVKYHTIRAGHRFKVGDKFSPRVWSGKPYRSKMIQFAPDIEVKNVFEFGMRMRGPYKEFYGDDCDLTLSSVVRVAMNDGFISSDDLYWWFNKPFTGQIISWNDKIEY